MQSTRPSYPATAQQRSVHPSRREEKEAQGVATAEAAMMKAAASSANAEAPPLLESKSEPERQPATAPPADSDRTFADSVMGTLFGPVWRFVTGDDLLPGQQ